MSQRQPAERLERAAVKDCWNKIGVRGDASCAELKVCVHCRNCAVYSAAAVELLDLELDSDYRAQGAADIAREKDRLELDTRSAVVFRVGGEWFALATLLLEEIEALRAIHSIPHRRDGALLGVVNIRGALLPCVSMHKILGLDPADAPQERTLRVSGRLLVLQHLEQRAVCPVDEVCGIARFHPRNLSPVPATVARATATYTRSVLEWQDKSVGLIEEELLFHTINRNLA
jgi:chemotaxis-related protein WspD